MSAAPRRVLVLGAYGLIGRAVARRLVAEGHSVTGLGRDAATAARVLPGVPVHAHDLRALVTPAAWAPLLAETDAVVNCAGALQDGPRDALEIVHHIAIAALARACAERGAQIVQISAAGVRPDAPTEFFASKARGDAAVRASGAPHQILRPGLVLAPSSYGSTALLRMLAAVPWVQPLALPRAQVQTVALEDLAGAVALCVRGAVPDGFAGDLVEDAPRPLAEIVAAKRAWLGFAPARRVITLGPGPTGLMARAADALGWLGWRSPLRSTALRTLRDGVTGDPAPWAALGHGAMRPLPDTLAAMEATAEHRLHARLMLLAPLLVAALFVMWMGSGLLGLARLGTAAEVLMAAGWGAGAAKASVVFWSLVDIALAFAVLLRRHAGRACLGMVAVSLMYLGAATLVAPGLWADPLGPLIKVPPAILAALVLRATLEAR